MIILFEQLGLLLEIIGVLIVLISQVRFGFRARKVGGMRRAFFQMIGPVRIDAGITEGKSDEYLRRDFQSYGLLLPFFVKTFGQLPLVL